MALWYTTKVKLDLADLVALEQDQPAVLLATAVEHQPLVAVLPARLIRMPDLNTTLN